MNKSKRILLRFGGLIALGAIASFALHHPPSRIPAETRPAATRYTDIHAHVACPLAPHVSAAEDRCFVSDQMKNSYKFPIYLKALGVTEAQLESHPFAVFDHLADRIRASSRVRRAVVLALDGWIDHASGALDESKTQLFVPNSFILSGVRRYAREGLFLYGASVNPYRRDALERLEQAKRDGAVLIKWIPSVMNIDPADPALKPFYEKMRELKLPLLVHTGDEATFVWADNSFGDPERLRFPLDLGVTVIAAHVATTGESDGRSEFSRLQGLFGIEKYRDHLFADISATTLFNHVRKFKSFIEDPVFHGRLVYGTDWPLVEVKIVGVSLVPYALYATPVYGSILSWGEVSELHSLSNALDRDVRLKELLGAEPELFEQTDRVLNR